MTTLLTKRFYFSAAHKMSNDAMSATDNARLFGLCQNIHGHNYFLDVTVGGKLNPKTQCIADLNIIKDIVNTEIISALDHQYLNDVLQKRANIKGLPLTLENLGQWIWKTLNQKFKAGKINLDNIRVGESETTSVIVSKK